VIDFIKVKPLSAAMMWSERSLIRKLINFLIKMKFLKFWKLKYF
jgi:hypothetical protein